MSHQNYHGNNAHHGHHNGRPSGSDSRRNHHNNRNQRAEFRGNRQQTNNHGPNNYRPHHKRQANGREFYLTLGVVGVFALVAIASRASSESLPLLIAVLVLIAAGVAAVVFWVAFQRSQKFRAVRISGIDAMDGFVFEKYVAELLKNQGFQNVQLTEKYDLGIDAIAERDGDRWGIQIKRNRGKTKALSVRQAVTALNHYKCTRAMVVSNNYFTGSATQLAASNRCVLINRDTLSEWILAYHRR